MSGYISPLSTPLICMMRSPFSSLFEKIGQKKRTKQILLLCLALVGMSAGIYLLSIYAPNLSAGILPDSWDIPFRDVDEVYTIGEDGNAVARIKALIWRNAVPLFKYIMVAVSILYAILFLMQMIGSYGNQESISAAQKSLLWEFLGFLTIALAADIAEAFDPFRNNGVFVDKAIVEDSQYRLVSYIQMIGGIVAIFYIFFAGFRLITAQGEEELIEDQKKHIKWGLLGLITLMLSDVIINRIFYPYEGEQGLGRAEIQTLIAEGVGVLRFFLAFTAVLAFISFLAAGVMYITSMGDDSATERARKIIFGSVVAIIIIVTSYLLVSVFIPPGAPQ